MQAKYALWLNGNSLVLIDRAVSDSRVEDLLNVQLAAYLTANKRHPSSVQGTDWHKEYLRIQSSFGCTLGTLQSSNTSVVAGGAFEPWAQLRSGLLGDVPSVLQQCVSECLDSLRTNADDAMQQMLWAECVRPPDSAGRSHVHAELRLVLPDSTVISTQLSFSTDALLGVDWLWKGLDGVGVYSSQQFDGRYLTNDKQIDAIGAGLLASIKSKRAQYRSLLSFVQDQESKYE